MINQIKTNNNTPAVPLATGVGNVVLALVTVTLIAAARIVKINTVYFISVTLHGNRHADCDPG